MSAQLAIAFSKVLGPRMARTPSGQPIQLSSVPFDLTTTTPQQAIAASALRWHGIVPHAATLTRDWVITAEYDVVVPAHRTAPAYTKLFVLEYVPERAIRAHKNITITDEFADSWYCQPVLPKPS